MEEKQEKQKNKCAGRRHGVEEKSWPYRCALFTGGLLGFYFISACLVISLYASSSWFLVQKLVRCIQEVFRQWLKATSVFSSNTWAEGEIQVEENLHIQCSGSVEAAEDGRIGI